MSESTELQHAVENLTLTIEQLRTDLVRKDVYGADQRVTDLRFAGLERAVAGIAESVSAAQRQREAEAKAQQMQRSADRRLMLTTFVAPFLMLLLQIYIASQSGGA